MAEIDKDTTRKTEQEQKRATLVLTWLLSLGIVGAIIHNIYITSIKTGRRRGRRGGSK